MKLEFESDTATPPLVDFTDFDEMISDNESPEITRLLSEGIEAAQKGERAVARTFLMRVTEAAPDNENAWLWLASISEYPEELLVFLKNVLDINPANERANEWAKATESLMSKTFVQRGIEATKSEQMQIARQCFLQAIVYNKQSELAWLWLASVSVSPEEKMSHLQKVLSINPANENAAASLRNAKTQMAKSLLPIANKEAINGNHVKAIQLLNEIVSDAPDLEDAWMLKAHLSESLEEKIINFERVIGINPDNQVAKANLGSLKMFVGSAVRQDDVIEESTPAVLNDDEIQVVLNDEVEPVEDSSPAAESVEFKAEDEAVEEVEAEAAERIRQEQSFAGIEAAHFDDDYFVELVDDAEMTDVPEESEEQYISTEAHFNEVSEDQSTEENFSREEEENDNIAWSEEFAQSNENDDSANGEAAALAKSNNESAFEEQELSEELQAVEDDDDEFSIHETFQPDSENEAESDAEVVAEAEYQDKDEAEVEDQDQDETSSNFEDEAVVNCEDDETADFDDADRNEAESDEHKFEENASEEPVNFGGNGHTEMVDCGFCSEQVEQKAFSCGSCRTVLTLSDIEMLLSQEDADRDSVVKAIVQMETAKNDRGVDLEELKLMGIGYINLKEYRKGFEYLKEASHKDANDVMFSSQVDALALRIAEVEEQENQHENQPKCNTILVVDDSPTVRKLIAGKLEKCGHEVICAVDGMDALAKVNEALPDLILLDITMPRMDGYQVCKLLRGNDATKDIPVVMISGKDGFFDKVRGKMAGTSHYITKPFGPETLMKTINEYIK